METLEYQVPKDKLENAVCIATFKKDGIDSDAFYSDGSVIDGFINEYRNILNRLATK